MNILDPRFKYTPAAKTDIRKTFARIRKEQIAATAQERTTALPEPAEKVRGKPVAAPIRRVA